MDRKTGGTYLGQRQFSFSLDNFFFRTKSSWLNFPYFHNEFYKKNLCPCSDEYPCVLSYRNMPNYRIVPVSGWSVGSRPQNLHPDPERGCLRKQKMIICTKAFGQIFF